MNVIGYLLHFRILKEVELRICGHLAPERPTRVLHTFGVLLLDSAVVCLDKQGELAGLSLGCRRAVRLEPAKIMQGTLAAATHFFGGVY